VCFEVLGWLSHRLRLAASCISLVCTAVPDQPACLCVPYARTAAAAGRLDFCTDSWALGLLVLSLRKGQQPFWWLKQEGRLPSGACICWQVSHATAQASAVVIE
jgi:hypothetical protein